MALTLSDNGSLHFELYRKPANLYQYLPRSSCHRRQTFEGLIIGEALRIHRRCLLQCDVAKHLRLFRFHLLKRGYANSEIQKCFKAASVRFSRPRITPHSSHSVRKAFIKVTHSSTVKYAALQRAISKHKHLCSSQIIISSSAQKNIFRWLYQKVIGALVLSTKLAVGG